MSFFNSTASTLPIGGVRTSGADVRAQNVLAAQSIANIVKTSLGPVGLDKMLVDSIGDVTISNDGATILRLLDVEHPAAKLLVELAQQQDKEVGDGTTSVVIIAAELLRRANELVKNKIHATTICSGYKLACKEAIKFIQDSIAIPVDDLEREQIINVAKTSMSSKIIGSNDEFFSAMVVDAMLAVKSTNDKGESKYPVKAVNILKAHGKSSTESRLINGYAVNCTIAAQSLPKQIKNAKIACLDFNLQRARMHLGVNIVVDDPDKLEDIRKREIEITTERIKKIIDAGANVILTTKGIDDLCIKLFVEAGAMAVRRVDVSDMKNVAKATGATFISTLANLEGDETFEASLLGHADEVVQERISDDECILIKGTKKFNSASIILRGANDYMLDEVERSVHDALCAVKRTLESKRVVPGGGSVEAALSIHLENFATTLASREQLAIAEFATALLVIPKTLAVNAAKDATDLVAKLRAYHNTAQASNLIVSGADLDEADSEDKSKKDGSASTSGDKKKDDKLAVDSNSNKYKHYGLNLMTGQTTDMVKLGVLEPAMSKIKSLKAATEAAIALLRIDDMIKIDAPEEQHGDDCH